jgi:hypothetical protein
VIDVLVVVGAGLIAAAILSVVTDVWNRLSDEDWSNRFPPGEEQLP